MASAAAVASEMNTGQKAEAIDTGGGAVWGYSRCLLGRFSRLVQSAAFAVSHGYYPIDGVDMVRRCRGPGERVLFATAHTGRGSGGRQALRWSERYC